MNILFITPYVPSRIRVRPLQILRELSKRHRVHVIALGEGGGEKVHGAEELPEIVESLTVVPHPKLRGLCQSLAALPSPTPMCAAFCWSPDMTRAIARAVANERFDVVHIEHLRAAHFASACEGLPIVFDSVDCLTGLFRQMSRSCGNPISRLVMVEEAIKLRRYEPRMLARFDEVIITCESERQELLALDPKLRVSVVPNGVDTSYFAPWNTDKQPARIVFSGKMSYHPNEQAALWFARNVFPAIRQARPDAEFVIIGSGPPPDVEKLACVPGISVTGYVDDIRPRMASASVAVVPMQVAVGIQNKVLEAMAMGLPVVATPLATRPFGAECPGIVTAESADDMTRQVLGLLSDQRRAAELGALGRNEAVQRFSWESSVTRLESVYEEAVRAAGQNRVTRDQGVRERA